MVTPGKRLMPDKTEEKSEKNLLSDLMNQIAGSGEDGKSPSFPVTMVLIGIMVLVLAVVGIKMAFAKRRAAELAYKIRKAEEEKAQAEEDVKLGENSEARYVANEEVKARQREILNLKAKMALRTAAHKNEVKKLESVTSWDDIEVVDARE
jgi:uncharacterized protein YxeA